MFERFPFLHSTSGKRVGGALYRLSNVLKITPSLVIFFFLLLRLYFAEDRVLPKHGSFHNSGNMQDTFKNFKHVLDSGYLLPIAASDPVV